MGGHGGLNILPQKKWNVYGRDNRLCVARDEDAAAERKEKALKEQRDREKDARYRALLKKQPGGHVVLDFEQQGQEGAEGLLENVSTSIVESIKVQKDVTAARERGDPKTQTCDPRFDASFKFAKGMQEAPWWVSEANKSIDKVEGQQRGKQGNTRSSLAYVKHASRKSRAREKKKHKKEMYEALRRERIEREARERQKVNDMIPH